MGHRQRWLVGALVVVAPAVALTVLAAVGQDSLATDGVIHVDADATSGDNNGTSWEHAFTTLQPALEAAVAGKQIWVAEGTYKPSWEFSPGDPRSATFQMKNGVEIYGGFAGTEDFLHERDWDAHPTILSGDIGVEGDVTDNSYHVFYHPSGTSLYGSAVLDGFTVTRGRANLFEDPHGHGGGMYNVGSSPTLSNCSFEGNSANFGGGGVSNWSFSSPTLDNCTFSGNSASSGGGMYNVSSSPALADCTFADNSAIEGGGMFNGGSSPTLTNCTFWNNWAGDGGGVFNGGSSPTLINCTFADNSTSRSGGAMYNSYSSSPTLTNCILWGDTPEEVYSTDSTPVVTYSDVQGGYPGGTNINEPPLFVDATGGDFHLQLDSPCIDAGANDTPDLPAYDFEGDDRILDGDGNVTRIVDMGVDEVAVEWPYFHVNLPVVLKGY